jgi:tryptophan-rich hypothetical protein
MAKKIKYPHLLKSKWTSTVKMWGWRHFQVINRQNDGEHVFAEMVSSCDSTVRFWINAKALKDRSQWQAGWQTRQEMTTTKDGTEEPEIIEC